MAWRAALIFIKGRIHPKAMREGFTAVSGTWAGVVISGVGHMLQSRRRRYTRFSAGKWLHNSGAMKAILEKSGDGDNKDALRFCLLPWCLPVQRPAEWSRARLPAVRWYLGDLPFTKTRLKSDPSLAFNGAFGENGLRKLTTIWMAAALRKKVEYPNGCIDWEAPGGQVSDNSAVLLSLQEAKLQTNPLSLLLCFAALQQRCPECNAELSVEYPHQCEQRSQRCSKNNQWTICWKKTKQFLFKKI